MPGSHIDVRGIKQAEKVDAPIIFHVIGRESNSKMQNQANKNKQYRKMKQVKGTRYR